MHTHVHGQQPKCPSTLEWIDTLACSYNGTAYRMKMNEIHYIQQCRHISKYWLKETGLERGYKTSFWDRANDLFCILGRGYTRIQFVTVHENVHISGVQFSVYILYVFNFTHKKWKKKKKRMKTSTFDQDRVPRIKYTLPPQTTKVLKTKVLKKIKVIRNESHIRKWRSLITERP